MVKDDHKADLAVILGKLGPKRDEDTEDTKDMEDDEDVDPGLEAASEELIAAVTAKDTRAVAAALRSAFDLCSATQHEE